MIRYAKCKFSKKSVTFFGLLTSLQNTYSHLLKHLCSAERSLGSVALG